MNVNELFPRLWLTPADFADGPSVLTVDAVTMATVRNPRTSALESKLCVAFQGVQARLLLNKTQALGLASLCGNAETQAWPGHRVTLSAGLAPNRKQTILVTAAPKAEESAALAAPAASEV